VYEYDFDSLYATYTALVDKHGSPTPCRITREELEAVAPLPVWAAFMFIEWSERGIQCAPDDIFEDTVPDFRAIRVVLEPLSDGVAHAVVSYLVRYIYSEFDHTVGLPPPLVTAPVWRGVGTSRTNIMKGLVQYLERMPDLIGRNTRYRSFAHGLFNLALQYGPIDFSKWSHGRKILLLPEYAWKVVNYWDHVPAILTVYRSHELQQALLDMLDEGGLSQGFSKSLRIFLMTVMDPDVVRGRHMFVLDARNKSDIVAVLLSIVDYLWSARKRGDTRVFRESFNMLANLLHNTGISLKELTFADSEEFQKARIVLQYAASDDYMHRVEFVEWLLAHVEPYQRLYQVV